MQKIKKAASEFLSNKRIAVTGVSRQPKNRGSNVVYQRLRGRGYQVFAVNPNANEAEGDPCYHDLGSVPGGVDAVVIATRPRRPNGQCANAPTSASSSVDAPRSRCRERLQGCR